MMAMCRLISAKASLSAIVLTFSSAGKATLAASRYHFQSSLCRTVPCHAGFVPGITDCYARESGHPETTVLRAWHRRDYWIARAFAPPKGFCGVDLVRGFGPQAGPCRQRPKGTMPALHTALISSHT